MRRAATWLPALLVAIAAVAATAHGAYEVAVAAGVPGGIAWLYPVITDGLALVAYAATSRLAGRAAAYAWVVVVVAAGLSGLAQAAFLARPGTALAAAPELRFGVGAWPAIAAAVVAHLLYLLATEQAPPAVREPRVVADLAASRNLPPAAPADAPVPLPDTAPAVLLPTPAPHPAPALRDHREDLDREPTGTDTGTDRDEVDQREGDRDPAEWAREEGRREGVTPGWRLIQREFPHLTESRARTAAKDAKAPASHTHLRSVL